MAGMGWRFVAPNLAPTLRGLRSRARKVVRGCELMGPPQELRGEGGELRESHDLQAVARDPR